MVRPGKPGVKGREEGSGEAGGAPGGSRRERADPPLDIGDATSDPERSRSIQAGR
jgi:hypothetical protein